MEEAQTIFQIALIALLYVGLMNMIGGKRHLFFNRIREIIDEIKNP